MSLADNIAVVIALYWTLYHGCTWATIVFEDTPGVVRIHPGEQATFSWKIYPSLDDIVYGSVSFNYGNLNPVFYRKISPSDPGTWNHGYGSRANMSFRDNNQRLSFTLRDAGEPDTGENYECQVFDVLTGNRATDSDASLFIYGTPNTPTFVPSQPSPPVTTRFTLTCSATSTSLPDDSSIRPAMTYAWTRDNGPLPADRHTASGGDLTINPVHKDDSLVTYTCTAQETGSRLSTDAGIQLDVQYIPGQPTLSVTPNPAVEGSSLRLECTLSDDQQGNPRVYTYRWWNTDHGGNYTRNTGSLNIDSATVAEHDGLWRCVVSNDVGPGVYGQIHVTVNSASEITKPPSEQRSILYSDNLTELCEVRAKPAASVTWSYNGGTLPDGVRTQFDSEQNGKYTISRSTLQSNPEASDDQRRRAGGRFTCHGVNVIGNVSASMDLTVLYGPINIELSDPGPITAVEGKPVSVTCSSDCSPSCTFTWTRSTLPAWSSPGPTLAFNQVTRDQHDTYICQADNGLENEKTAQVVINVNFGSEVTSFSSLPADVLHGDPATLVCSVSSRPNSTITISSSSNVLRSSFDQQAEYHLESASILDSGTYRCAAENYISSDDREFVFDVEGGFNLCEYQENTESRGIALKATFEERICQFANPFPNITRNNWMFESANLTGIDTVLPEDIEIGMNPTEHRYKKIIVFQIPQTFASHYGNYTLTSKNQYGSELIFTLILMPDGPPEPPYDLRCTRVTAVSVYIEWKAGYHGGAEQRFVIIYTNTNTGDVNTVETDSTEYRLAENEQILPAQTYRIQVNAVNDNGITAGPTVINMTLAQPEFEGNPSIDIQGDTAYITWPIVNIDSVTRVSVDSCGPQKDANCITTNITDLSTTPYVVNVPEVDTIHFNFTFYDGQDVAHHQGYKYSIGGGSQVAIIVGAVVGVVAVAALVVLLVMLWRKGILSTRKSSEPEQVVHYENVAVDITEGDKEQRKTTEVQYEDVGNLAFSPDDTDTKVYEGLIGEEINKTPVVYEAYGGEKTEVVQYPPSDIRPGDMISRGAVFCVQAAVILRGKLDEKARNIVIKQLVTTNADLLKRYLVEAAQVLSRLDKCQHVVFCAGMAGSSILMENIPLGNLRQYLRGMADHAYANTADAIQKECLGFVQQVIKGLEAVASISPGPLFYCLSTDHVLLGHGQICKLTGFNSAKSVRQREQWEQEMRISRPLRWLAPEAIDLRHIPESDIWTFGVLVWEIFQFGLDPYPDADDSQIVEFVKCSHRQLEMPRSTPQSVCDLMSTCWVITPEMRPSLDRINKAINILDCD